MDIDALTDDIWRDIMRLYYKAVYRDFIPDERNLYHTAVDAIQQINEGFRFGSRFSINSKLQPTSQDGKLLHFDFYVNAHEPEYNDPTTLQGQQVLAAHNKFIDSVSEYLTTNRLAVEP